METKLTPDEALLIDRIAATYDRVVREGGEYCGAAIEIRMLIGTALKPRRALFVADHDSGLD